MTTWTVTYRVDRTRAAVAAALDMILGTDEMRAETGGHVPTDTHRELLRNAGTAAAGRFLATEDDNRAGTELQDARTVITNMEPPRTLANLRDHEGTAYHNGAEWHVRGSILASRILGAMLDTIDTLPPYMTVCICGAPTLATRPTCPDH